MLNQLSLFVRSIFCFVSIITPLSATIIDVPADSTTIQRGINGAVDGDTVLVAEGIYYENIYFNGKAIILASHFLVDGDTSYISNTIIDGSHAANPDTASVVYMVSDEDSSSVLSGFTITGGEGTLITTDEGFFKDGGGILILDGGGKIENNIIRNNHVSHNQRQPGGGGIFAYLGEDKNIVIRNNTIENNIVESLTKNVAGAGLVLFCKTAGLITVKNNLIRFNVAICNDAYKAIGGGIFFWSPLPTLSDVIIKNNIISNNELHCIASHGGGIYVVYTEPGGQISDPNPCPEISNNVICNNYSQDMGGGIAVWTIEYNHSINSVISPQPTITNNTLANNTASDGAGLFNYDSYPLLMNNIFWNDLSIEGSREFFNDSIYYPEYPDHNNRGEIFASFNDIQEGWEGEGNIDLDPLFCHPNGGNFSLVDDSPCIATGQDSVNMGALDIGCTVDVDDLANFPDEYALLPNYPNPFNPSTTINYELPKQTAVSLIIYDIRGKHVAILQDGAKPSGNYEVRWNGMDNSGNQVSTGVYFCRLQAGEFSKTIKMVYLR